MEFIDFKPYGAKQGYSTYCEKWITKIMATKSILLIDDEETVRELVSVCLSDLAGWDCNDPRNSDKVLRVVFLFYGGTINGIQPSSIHS